MGSIYQIVAQRLSRTSLGVRCSGVERLAHRTGTCAVILGANHGGIPSPEHSQIFTFNVPMLDDWRPVIVDPCLWMR